MKVASKNDFLTIKIKDKNLKLFTKTDNSVFLQTNTRFKYSFFEIRINK